MTAPLDELIRRVYPFPLARAWSWLRPSESPGDEIKQGLECFEVVLRFAVAIQLADVLSEESSEEPSKARRKVLAEAVRALTPTRKAVSVGEGGYAHALEGLNQHLRQRKLPPCVPALAAWHRGATRGAGAAIGRLIEARNRWSHHLESSDELNARELARGILSDLQVVFESIRALESCSLLLLQGNPALRERYEGHLVFMRGIDPSPKPRTMAWSAPLRSDGVVYLLDPQGRVLLLSPLMYVPDRRNLGTVELFSHLGEREVMLRGVGSPEMRAEPLSAPWEVWCDGLRSSRRLMVLGSEPRAEVEAPRSPDAGVGGVRPGGAAPARPLASGARGRRWRWGVGAAALLVLAASLVAFSGAWRSDDAVGLQGTGPRAPLRPKTPPHFELVYVPAGTFMEGSPPEEVGREPDEVQREVTLTRPFWIQTSEVTVGQWEAVMGSDPSYLRCGRDCPVELISWFDAVTFLNRASKLHGLEPCYTLIGAEGTPGSGCPARKPGGEAFNDGHCNGELRYSAVELREGCAGYRLPTEAEWEYAARAGTTGARYGEAHRIAWSQENVPDCPSTDPERRERGCKRPVMSREPNAWGLYDMLGNVAEWTWDADLPRGAEAVTDPRYDAGGSRVMKGGSWTGTSRTSRAARRLPSAPRNRSRAVGFRVARSWTGEEHAGQAPSAELVLPVLVRVRVSGEGVTSRELEVWPTEVTQAQWAAVLGERPARFGGCDACPVERVSWYDALRFLNALSEREGLERCYELRGCEEGEGDACPDGAGWCDPPRRCEGVSYSNDQCSGYRLPTEAEWAALATGASGELEAHAWTRRHAAAPQQVGALSPNAHGLYDTMGNVWEWVWTDAALRGPGRVCGCGFMDDAARCQPGVCTTYPRQRGGQDVGLRPVRSLSP